MRPAGAVTAAANVEPRGTRPRVLMLARNYPNNVLPTLGIWTQRLVRAAQATADPVVVSPVPYSPPGLPIEDFARFRKVLPERDDDGIPVYHPRVPTLPGSRFARFDASLAYPFIRRLADRLHEQHRFDLIHAHFIYPDGVMAARLGQRYGIPVVTMEQSLWLPWLEKGPVRAQVLSALPRIARVIAVSEAVRRSALQVGGATVATSVVHNVVDEESFSAATDADRWDPDQIAFVGIVRHVKGLDVLVRAMALLRERRPALRLLVVGEPFFRGYRRDEMAVRALIDELQLWDRISFSGQASPVQVAAAMRQSALLVSSSRREAFAAVIIEALASGTPVVATRCGGPEEIVTPEVGRLVSIEDPPALADAIDEMLAIRHTFDRQRLRDYVIGRFGEAEIASRLGAVYLDVLSAIPAARDR